MVVGAALKTRGWEVPTEHTPPPIPLVNGSLVRIRSWSIIKSKANISFFYFVSAFFSDTIRVFISKLTRAKVENGKTVC